MMALTGSVSGGEEAEPGGVWVTNTSFNNDKTRTWTVPANVNFIYAVAVGAGGGAGR
jgi:hypothetical protein